MPDVEMTTVPAGSLPAETMVMIPASPSAWFNKLAFYTTQIWSFKVPRNYAFHKKFFALLNFAFDNWAPQDEYKGHKVQKNSDKFRNDVTCLAGHYEIVASLGGNGVTKIAKSISWAKMSEEEFTVFYDAAKDAIWAKVFSNIDSYTRDEFERVCLELSSF